MVPLSKRDQEEYMSGEELRAIRLALGMTQAEMAEQIGISRTFIGLMERGKKPVSQRTAAAIHAARPRRSNHVPNETDPIIRRLEEAIVSQGIDFIKRFQSEGQEFDFYFPELSLAIVVDRDFSALARPTRNIRSVIVARGAGAADSITLLLQGRSLRVAAPLRLPLSI